MSTKSGFTPEEFRAQSEAQLDLNRTDPMIAYHIGKSAGYLANAADYIKIANELLAITLKILELPCFEPPMDKLIDELKINIKEILE